MQQPDLHSRAVANAQTVKAIQTQGFDSHDAILILEITLSDDRARVLNESNALAGLLADLELDDNAPAAGAN